MPKILNSHIVAYVKKNTFENGFFKPYHVAYQSKAEIVTSKKFESEKYMSTALESTG